MTKFEGNWSDEACQYWIDRAIQESRRMQLSGREFDEYFRPQRPDPVTDYIYIKGLEALAAAFETDPTYALSELGRAATSVNVHISPADR